MLCRQEGSEGLESGGTDFAICAVMRFSDCDCACRPNGVARAGLFQRHSPLDARFLMNGMGLSCEAMAMHTVARRLLAARLRMLSAGFPAVTG